MRKFLQGSFVLIVANFTGGALSYLFQARAAARLELIPYGALNTWMAYLTLGLAAGGVAQFSSNFHPLRFSRLKGVGAITLSASLLAAALCFWARASLEGFQFALGAVSLVFGVVFQFLVGQLQGRFWFAAMGTALVAGAAVRFGLTFLPPAGAAQFYLAFPVSYASGCAVIGATLLFAKKPKAEPHAVKENAHYRKTLLCSVVLALAMALIPQVDFLCIRWTQGDAAVGMFARCALFAKAIYFGALALLQATLPFHVKAHRGELDSSASRKVRLLETLSIGACVVGSFVFAAIAPAVARRFLGFDLSEYRLWVLLSCLCLTALFAHLQHIQFLCAIGHWRAAAYRVVGIMAFMLVVVLIRPASVPMYLSVALGAYCLLEFATRWLFNDGDAPLRQK